MFFFRLLDARKLGILKKSNYWLNLRFSLNKEVLLIGRRHNLKLFCAFSRRKKITYFLSSVAENNFLNRHQCLNRFKNDKYVWKKNLVKI